MDNISASGHTMMTKRERVAYYLSEAEKLTEAVMVEFESRKRSKPML